MSARTPEWKVAKAREWREKNPAAWAAMERLALDYADKRIRTSAFELVARLRYGTPTNGTVGGFKFNHTLCPIFARMLIADHPELSRFIEVRKADVDRLKPCEE